jgi:hypothetical protein
MGSALRVLSLTSLTAGECGGQGHKTQKHLSQRCVHAALSYVVLAPLSALGPRFRTYFGEAWISTGYGELTTPA